jgi:hypothetical protein
VKPSAPSFIRKRPSATACDRRFLQAAQRIDVRGDDAAGGVVRLVIGERGDRRSGAETVSSFATFIACRVRKRTTLMPQALACPSSVLMVASPGCR